MLKESINDQKSSAAYFLGTCTNFIQKVRQNMAAIPQIKSIKLQVATEILQVISKRNSFDF
jgi:hypothetical protein